jgi:hypothetical protein
MLKAAQTEVETHADAPHIRWKICDCRFVGLLRWGADGPSELRLKGFTRRFFR